MVRLGVIAPGARIVNCMMMHDPAPDTSHLGLSAQVQDCVLLFPSFMICFYINH